jgi:hypothetical protein
LLLKRGYGELGARFVMLARADPVVFRRAAPCVRAGLIRVGNPRRLDARSSPTAEARTRGPAQWSGGSGEIVAIPISGQDFELRQGDFDEEALLEDVHLDDDFADFG